jgi:dTDP-4-dehydrorhamnose 3,5-epimerase
MFQNAFSMRLAGLQYIRPRLFQDERGYFLESYRQPSYLEEGLPLFVQDNLSFSKRNTLRGLHYQTDPGQAKLVTCLLGKILDVVVDLRPDSSTFGEWEAVELDGDSHAQFFIPVGFAHGYCSLTDTTLVQYKVSALYDPKAERSIRWNDPDLKIDWPISDPILSPRDAMSPFFRDVFGEIRQ